MKKWACADCGNEQDSDLACEECASVRVVLVSVLIAHWGDDWKKLIEGTPNK